MLAVSLATAFVVTGAVALVVLARRPNVAAELTAYLQKLKDGELLSSFGLPIAAKVFGLLAGVAWCVAVYSAIEMLQWVKPGITLWDLAFNSMAFWDNSTWLPEARPHKQRFLTAIVIFFCLCVPSTVLGVLASSKSTKSEGTRAAATVMH